MGKSPTSYAGTSAKRGAGLASRENARAGNGRDGDFQVNLLEAMLSFRKGDFSARLPIGLSGVQGKIADAFNEVVAMSDAAPGKPRALPGWLEGGPSSTTYSDEWFPWRLGRRSRSSELAHGRPDPTDHGGRTHIGAVAKGDLGQSMALEVDGRRLKGEFLRSAKLVNTMIEQLAVFTSEVTRVAREVGTEGKLGGQAQVRGVSGVWKDLTENVNQMAGNLTAQVRNIADVTTAVASGDLSSKITVDVKGEILELKKPSTRWWISSTRSPSEVTRVAREVGTEGKLGGQAQVRGVAGTWKDLTDNVNSMASNLTAQVRNIADVTTAVARGRSVAQDHRRCEGRDSGAEGNHQHDGGPAQRLRRRKSRAWRAKSAPKASSADRRRCPGVAGTWKDLTDNVNSMANNLTAQVRNIADVTTAVARATCPARSRST